MRTAGTVAPLAGAAALLTKRVSADPGVPFTTTNDAGDRMVTADHANPETWDGAKFVREDTGESPKAVVNLNWDAPYLDVYREDGSYNMERLHTPFTVRLNGRVYRSAR